MGYVDLNQNKRQDWMTPPDCRDLLSQLGPLILDVCTNPNNPMEAAQFYTPEINGLKQSWIPEQGGLSWCNFPWSRKESPIWVKRACDEGDRLHREERHRNEMVLLAPSRSDTFWFRRLWDSCDAVYFWRGRMTFWNPDTGKPCMNFDKKRKKWVKTPVPVPVLLAYWGSRPSTFVEVFMQQKGAFAYPTPF